MMPDPLQIIQRTDPIDDETDEGSTMPENKPRRKYIPAQDKIQIELKEQMKRENELSQLRARWKSTPDLSNSVNKPDEDKEEAATDAQAEGDNDELTKPSSLRRQMSTSTQKLTMMPEVTSSDVIRMNKPTVRRRNSALINQWEELIKQQQQKNSSKN